MVRTEPRMGHMRIFRNCDVLETKRSRSGKLRDEIRNFACADCVGGAGKGQVIFENGRIWDGINIGYHRDHESVSSIPLDGSNDLRGRIVVHLLGKVDVGVKDRVTIFGVKEDKTSP